MYDHDAAPLRTVEDPERAFRAYMAEKGFDYIEVIADGKIHRFGDNNHGWYIMFPDGPCPAGEFGSWKTGEKHNWSANGRNQLTPAQRLTFNNQMAEAKKKREAEQARRNEAARKKAAREWDAASPAPQDHPYLQTKGVLSYGLKVNQAGQLVVPIRDNDGVVWSLQTIDQNGVKLFLPGGAKKGSYFTIGGGDNIYICEGYATGASLHEATGATVIIAFDSGNLKPVAQNIKAKYADRQIVICGDNDQWTDKNPGVTKAQEAGVAIGARVIIPEFKDKTDKPTDFNDLAQVDPQAVKSQIDACTRPLKAAVISLSEFLKIKIEERKAFLHPWLKEESINLIYGWRGAGKTWFALSIADAITRGGTFGPWDCLKSVPCLYLDGEMTISDDQERIRALNLMSARKSPFYIYSDHYANQLGLPSANLTDEAWRNDMKALLIDNGVKLWVVDNIASLASGLDENAKKDWDPINKWFLELRFAGITTILLHHETKDGKQRGTSAREDNLDISIQLKKPSDYTAEDGCRFITNFEKARVAHKYLPLIGDIEFQLTQDEDRKYIWTHASSKLSQKVEALKMLDEGVSQAKIATKLNVNQATVSRIKKKAIADGHLTKDGKLTQSGHMYLADLG